MKHVLALLIGCVLTFHVANAGGAPSTVTDSFRQLQLLAGDWRGTDEHGHAVKSTFQLIASDTAVMETLAPTGMETMVTLYSIDRDAITLIHYCPTNNQPRMRAIPRPDHLSSLVFEFLDAGNLASLAEGHEHRLVIDFKDRDHVDEHWTWRRDGSDTEMTFRLVRIKAQ
jgi:hypothetical protein